MMATPNLQRPLPGWLQVAASIVAVGHLLLIGLYSLAASSGPWPMAPGYPDYLPPTSDGIGPQFARVVGANFAFPYYLQPLQMTHNYHFASNRPSEFAVYFEVRLKNDLGDVRTLKFPDDKANPWVRHRQEVLAQHLVPDIMLPPAGAPLVGIEIEEKPTVDLWVRDAELRQHLEKVGANSKKRRTPGVDQPTTWSKALVKSYVRYLCREHNATSAQFIRYTRRTVRPEDMFMPRRADIYKELVSDFGEYRRE